MIIKKLYTEKYRPKNIDGMILLPRIQKQLLNEDGEVQLSGNYLFASTPGTGKTSLANVLVPAGALKVNASYNSSVEDLKEQVIDYCRTSDIFGDTTVDGYKIVYLDEFDGVSQKYQEALRGFIEDYSDRVRFFATCNNLSKISPAMLSRFTVLKFDPENQEEIDYLKDAYFERCELVKEKNTLNVSDEQLKSIINITFPDFRSVLNTLQSIEKTGGYDKATSSSMNVDLYNIIFGQIKEDKTYAWVIENYGDKVENLLKMCGRPLASYIFEQKPDIMNRIPRIMRITNDSLNQVNTTPDPVVLALSCIYGIQEVINMK
jgi:DNA polymerase III delta prime subunit